MSNDLPVLTSLTENSTDVPVSAGQVENYVLLLVLLSVFAGGTLVLLSLLLLFCHRCCLGGRRYSRASDDPEKTNTTYAEDSQPTQEITIRLDESDALSASSFHDGESERFVSTGSTGRRVSFNESALYEQEKTTQDKARRYTLTEGDFHHLKKARLTHLHLPPAPCDLKILTIMECDSTESSTININETAMSKLPLTIYQPPDRRIPDWMGQSLSGGLPGDPHHSIVLDQECRRSSLAMKTQHTRSQTMEALGNRGEAESEWGQRGEPTQPPSQTSVLHFFSKLRRHASLEGAGPYFKRWKFDTSHRAASLDAKGSPKRRPFQRQRAASENTDHTEDESSPLPEDAFESFPHTPIQTSGLQSLSAESLSHPAAASTTSVFLRRLKLEAMVEVGGSISSRRDELRLPSDPAQRREEATFNGPRVEEETMFRAVIRTEAAGDELESAEDDDLFGAEQEAAMQERFDDMLMKTDTNTGGSTVDVRKKNETEVDDGDEVVLGAEARQRTDSGSSLSFMIRQESSEAPPSLYRDIWSLRASLEQYASSDQSSTDHESIRSDADSISSIGGAGARSGLDSCLSQDLDDEPEGEGEGEGLEGGTRGASGVDSEMGSGAGGEGEGGNRKLLQMDSGYASIEAPSKAPEEMRLFGTPGAPRGKTASERRLFFTNAGRKGSVCESTEARLFQEELEDQMVDGTGDKTKQKSQISGLSYTLQEPHQLMKSLHPQKTPESHTQLLSPVLKPVSQPSSPHRPRLRRRDYSIDEKTDALFNEFLRHDPRFDQQDSPLRSRHRSRVHLRKQWQRHKQYSDPGSVSGGRYSPSLERQRFVPLRRGDSAGYPLDTRYHSTLSRIASAADEEASEVAASEEAAKERAESKDQKSEGAAENAAESAANKTCEVTTTTKSSSSCEESTAEADGHQVSPNKDTESTTIQSVSAVTAHMSHMDPRVDNRNNNSSQAILSEVSLQAESSVTDKLVVSVEERLYGGLRSAEKPGQAGSECELTVSHTASPGFSPI
ncbi:voltage-dependent calcium channel beta subunit-associated regulatory protein [Melanotaenia boesemani]|uniref:voltage-dependent calcium channel beta subunit-associated regulatory protein n=1 Tax=Melanotaenia boesemani TaxID=1250792 RepID=UPI001C044E01|nr:voltage-dependent calcium channel beta subunit-associated regulatory protein [Melanotaenia boesemani]XP_041848362.1 voltage-dependent calcium channel beta subunit-associated regulatory protein [Melanotaenia boesemani]